ncbi:MAG: class I SAM-dependent methyltransferase [Nanoarchaeota archaeon]|nr:class I SAM-dependent methyltransferase [Nanoarchaeota archaeon]
METKRWHKAYSKQKYHPFLSEKKAREKRMKTMGLFDLGKDAMILDVGCGTGITMHMLMKKGYHNVYGIEPSKKLIEKSPVKNKISVGNAQNIGFPDNTFDCVYLAGVLHHLETIENIIKCFKEIRRVLKPGGLFSYNEPYQTKIRWIGEKIIFSPLSNLFYYSRHMRVVLEEEKESMSFWLKNVDKIEQELYKLGFRKELRHIGLYRITIGAKKV